MLLTKNTQGHIKKKKKTTLKAIPTLTLPLRIGPMIKTKKHNNSVSGIGTWKRKSPYGHVS